MKILNRYVLNNIKLNKKRSLTLIIGISLYTMLICSVLILAMTFYKTSVNNVISNKGNYHTTFFKVPKDNNYFITQNNEIESYFITQEIGYTELKNSDGRDYLAILEFDERALNNYGLKLVTGRLPKNSNEIVISEQLEVNGNIKYRVGQTIELELNRLILDNSEVISQKTTYLKSMKKENRITEEFLGNKTYKIVGIIKRPNEAIEPYKAAGYTAISMIDKISDYASYSVKYKDVKKAFEIEENLSLNNNVGYGTNYELLNLFGVAEGFSFVKAISFIIIIMIIILTVCSTIILKSGFDILISDKIKQYSILSCIGAKKSEIKKLAFKENNIICTIGIIIGIFFSIIFTSVLIIIIKKILVKNDGLLNVDILYNIPFWVILVSIILSYISVYFASMKALKRINNISPITTYMQNVENNIVIEGKKVKIQSLIKKIFGIGGVISYKNIIRNNKKYNSILYTLIISICMIIGVNSFVNYTHQLTTELYQTREYNILLGYKAFEKDNIKYNTLTEISKSSYINKSSLSRIKQVFLDLTEHVSKEKYNFYLSKCSIDDKFGYSILALGEDEYKRYVEKIGADYNACKNGVIWKNDIISYMSDGNKKVKLIDLKVGDTIKAETMEEKQKINLEVSYITDISPMGYENTNSQIGQFIISDELFDKLFKNYKVQYLAVNTNSPQEFCKYIEKNYDEILAKNIELEILKESQTTLIITILLYGITVIITIIAITNIYNILSSNITLRKREFSILKSIGMTRKEFNHLIYLESLFYCIESIIFGTLLGVGINTVIYYFASKINIVRFMLSANLILVINIFILVLVIVIEKYCLKNVNNESIIENIRNENI